MATDDPPPGTDPREPTRRLFFALWPDEAMRAAMAQAVRKAARASGGRPVPADNLHVTLAFLGSVPERRLSDLAAAARGAAQGPRSLGGANPADDPLELVFDRLEYWRAGHLLCALPADPPARVADLARKLQDALVGRGFTLDLKSSWSVGISTTRQFRPHITVARKVHRPLHGMKIDPLTWSFADFVLVDSRTLPAGSVYTILERFPLAY